MPWYEWVPEAGFAAVVTGVLAWWFVGLFGPPAWLSVVLVVAGVVVFAPLVVWYVVMPVTAGLAGLWDARHGRAADHDFLERFRSMSINQVRRRADDFDRRAADAERNCSRTQRKTAFAYGIPAREWRALEVAMREAGAFDVGDLPEEEVEGWGRKLGLYRSDVPEPPQKGPGRPEPERRTVQLPPRKSP